MIVHAHCWNVFDRVSVLIQSLYKIESLNCESIRILYCDGTLVALLIATCSDNVICVYAWLFVYNLISSLDPFVLW